MHRTLPTQYFHEQGKRQDGDALTSDVVHVFQNLLQTANVLLRN